MKNCIKVENEFESLINELENKTETLGMIGNKLTINKNKIILDEKFHQDEEFSTSESFNKSKSCFKKNKIFKSSKNNTGLKNQINNNQKIVNESNLKKSEKLKKYHNTIMEKEIKLHDVVSQIKERYQNDITKKRLSYLEMANRRVNNFNKLISNRTKIQNKESNN